MRIEDERVGWRKLYIDAGEESQKAKDLLVEKGILFGEIKWARDFPANATIRGEGPLGDKKLGASTALSPPVLEVYFGPGKYLVLGGFNRIQEGIESEW